MTAKKNISTRDGEEAFSCASPIDHLTQSQLDRLMDAFREWNRSAVTEYIRKVRGRYWLAFLMLRFTGARIGEILSIDDSAHIDFDRNEIMIVRRKVARIIPVPAGVILRVCRYRAEFPVMQGKVFVLDQGNFRREFYRRAEEAEIPRELSHPHILRHTRAVEMLQAGVPLTAVQEVLGHSLSSTTAMYLQCTQKTLKEILNDKGLL